jgi:hypothetical protein
MLLGEKQLPREDDARALASGEKESCRPRPFAVHASLFRAYTPV